ncbi:hypothetical protein [Actinomadura macrotermitis]|uniref:Transposase n=1 Tax=Actinomadura macrotermitis TaxID=2585200 RepID=A0A7K0C2I8_9ACTN|nr:hypothetical protein [Actinomadura macrotermitis]
MISRRPLTVRRPPIQPDKPITGAGDHRSNGAVTWLVHRGNRRLRHRGTIAGDAWLHTRAAALDLRRLINLGLTRSNDIWHLSMAEA